MEPAGGDPGQGHQAQAGGGVPAEPAAGRRATAVAAAAATVATVPQPGRRDGAVRRRRAAAAGRGQPGRWQVAGPGGGRTLRLQRVPVARGRPETRTGRAAGPGYRDGGGESVERGADPSVAGRTQVGRVREQGARGSAVRQRRQVVFRGGHVDREEII